MLGRFLMSMCIIGAVVYTAYMVIDTVRPTLDKVITSTATTAEDRAGKPINQR